MTTKTIPKDAVIGMGLWLFTGALVGICVGTIYFHAPRDVHRVELDTGAICALIGSVLGILVCAVVWTIPGQLPRAEPWFEL